MKICQTRLSKNIPDSFSFVCIGGAGGVGQVGDVGTERGGRRRMRRRIRKRGMDVGIEKENVEDEYV